MEKLKIKGISSKEYPGGRIDSYEVRLPDEYVNHSHIIPLFIELGFPEDVVNEELDVIYDEIGYIFIYGNPKIKAHLFAEDKFLSIKFDTSLPKEEVNKIVEKYFEFP